MLEKPKYGPKSRQVADHMARKSARPLMRISEKSYSTKTSFPQVGLSFTVTKFRAKTAGNPSPTTMITAFGLRIEFLFLSSADT